MPAYPVAYGWEVLKPMLLPRITTGRYFEDVLRKPKRTPPAEVFQSEARDGRGFWQIWREHRRNR